VYKASYSGLVKVFLDLLPQAGPAGKTVLPLVTGGSLAHMLAMDYALRPVLSALGARHVVPGAFLLDSAIERLGADTCGSTRQPSCGCWRPWTGSPVRSPPGSHSPSPQAPELGPSPFRSLAMPPHLSLNRKFP
jgi:hypothetical protein